jgi:1-deoxy-D-xylulose-5-phosphate reductoisomerase
LARQALADGGTAPTVLNAANEVAVAAFLAGRLGFLEIAAVVEATLEARGDELGDGLEQILSVDAEARRHAETLVANWPRRPFGHS